MFLLIDVITAGLCIYINHYVFTEHVNGPLNLASFTCLGVESFLLRVLHFNFSGKNKKKSSLGQLTADHDTPFPCTVQLKPCMPSLLNINCTGGWCVSTSSHYENEAKTPGGTAILCWWHHLEPESVQQWGCGAMVSRSRAYTHLIHGAFHLSWEVGISEYVVGFVNWNTAWSKISDLESWRNLTIRNLKIQDGCSVHQQ